MDVVGALLFADSWGRHGDVGWGWMTVMMIGMLLFWSAIILGVVWLIRNTAWGQPPQGDGLASKESPVEILERRFAEGAVTLEEYQARRDVLVGEGPHSPAAAN